MTSNTTHGGFRIGAGRPKKAKQAEAIQAGLTPMEYLLGVMRNPENTLARRTRAAALLLPYMHAKPGGAGVKDARQIAGEKAASGKFAVPRAPRLAVVTTLRDKE